MPERSFISGLHLIDYCVYNTDRSGRRGARIVVVVVAVVAVVVCVCVCV